MGQGKELFWEEGVCSGSVYCGQGSSWVVVFLCESFTSFLFVPSVSIIFELFVSLSHCCFQHTGLISTHDLCLLSLQFSSPVQAGQKEMDAGSKRAEYGFSRSTKLKSTIPKSLLYDTWGSSLVVSMMVLGSDLGLMILEVFYKLNNSIIPFTIIISVKNTD